MTLCELIHKVEWTDLKPYIERHLPERPETKLADYERLFEQLQKAERRAKGKEQAFGMVSDMLAAYPDEFDALLNKSRQKKAEPYYKGNSRGNDRGGK